MIDARRPMDGLMICDQYTHWFSFARSTVLAAVSKSPLMKEATREEPNQKMRAPATMATRYLCVRPSTRKNRAKYARAERKMGRMMERPSHCDAGEPAMSF